MSIESLQQSFVYESDFDAKKAQEAWVRSIIEDEQTLLSKTGYNVAANIAQYIELNRQGNREGYRSLTEKDTIGYTLEFSLGEPVIPYEIMLSNENTEPEILTRDYITGKWVPLLSLLNPNERDGAVVRRTQQLAQLLHDAQPGSVFVTTSPDGQHGLINDESVAYVEYNHTQTGIYFVQEDRSIKAYTIRSSMSLWENEQLLQTLTNFEYIPKNVGATKYDRIVDVVDTVVAAPSITSLSDAVNTISKIRGSNPFWNNIKYTGEYIKEWSSSEVIDRLPHVDDLRNVKETISPVLSLFWQKVEANVQGESIDELRLLASYVRDCVLESSFSARRSTLEAGKLYDLITELQYNEGLSGCVTFIQSEYGPRALGQELGINYAFDVKGTCKSEELCRNHNDGKGEMLAVCGFCLKCDIAIRQGELKIADVIRNKEQKRRNVTPLEEEPRFSAQDLFILTVSEAVSSALKIAA